MVALELVRKVVGTVRQVGMAEIREGIRSHKEGASAGDIKIAAGTPGINTLPDGTTAITAKAAQEIAAASEAAKAASSEA